MDDKRQTEMESEGLMDLLHYQFGFALCGAPCLWAYIPLSLHPLLCLFSPSEPIMRELYRPRQISVSLPHNTNNRSYHERREGRIFCTALTNTRSHLVWVSVFSSPGYFRLALCCEEHQSEADEELFSFPNKWGWWLVLCYQDVWSAQ